MICLIITAGLFTPGTSFAQSLTGATGLVTIPTARMCDDGNLSIGMSYFDKKYQDFSDRSHDFMSAYASLTFLPFLEVTVRLNYPNKMRWSGSQPINGVDRVPMVRLRLLREKKYLPAIVAGIHDFASTSNDGTVFFNATYLVLSKKISAVDLQLGYAPKIMDANHYQLTGMFGGVSYSPFHDLFLLAEYDSRYVNTGVQLLFLNHFYLDLASLNFDSYAAGLGFHLLLK